VSKAVKLNPQPCLRQGSHKRELFERVHPCSRNNFVHLSASFARRFHDTVRDNNAGNRLFRRLNPTKPQSSCKHQTWPETRAGSFLNTYKHIPTTRMAPSLPQFSAARMRSYVFRLPLFTRLIILVIIFLWIASYQSVWDVVQWGALIPDEIGLSTSPYFPISHSCVLWCKFMELICLSYSVPDEYLPSHSCRLLPHLYECSCPYSAIGEIRGRVRDFDYIGAVLGS
jgi:hypothetical protein